jgi:hypothetical protein
MISIRNKLKIPVAPLPEPPPTFQNTAYLPEISVTNSVPVQRGNEFNLVRLVQENGPTHIKNIDMELDRLHEKIRKLEKEREQIMKLMAALEPVE